jgi:hypothetical protein
MKKYDRIKEETNILYKIKRKNVNWVGHVLGRNCFLEHFTEGKIERGTEVMGR